MECALSYFHILFPPTRRDIYIKIFRSSQGTHLDFRMDFHRMAFALNHIFVHDNHADNCTGKKNKNIFIIIFYPPEAESINYTNLEWRRRQFTRSEHTRLNFTHCQRTKSLNEKQKSNSNFIIVIHMAFLPASVTEWKLCM